jgi:hypothetical protein
MKIIVWGYPTNTHTHSFTHAAWEKAFKYLGYETYWFDDINHPVNFDYSNSIFITEGYADNKIPLDPSSTYFVHICRNPEKYLAHGCRVIDLRFDVLELNDCNYNMTVDHSKMIKVGPCVHYIEKADDSVLADQYKRNVSGYEAAHISWATDLLPEEINFDDIYKRRENIVYWIGSISESNIKEINKFQNALKRINIPFYSNDPWNNPISDDQVKEFTQKSFMAPDLRGTAIRREINGKPDTGSNHKNIGYIPCRIFKNISYGQLGITNSERVRDLFDGNIIYNDDEDAIVEASIPFLKNYEKIKSQMLFVKDKHTYINRAESLIKIYNKDL